MRGRKDFNNVNICIVFTSIIQFVCTLSRSYEITSFKKNNEIIKIPLKIHCLNKLHIYVHGIEKNEMLYYFDIFYAYHFRTALFFWTHRVLEAQEKYQTN